MGERRQSRELALQGLFFIDMEDSDLKGQTQSDIDAFRINNEEQLTQGVEPFFNDLISGVVQHRSQIDELINTYSKNWKISRMPAVDRNIMRIAVYEFLHRDDIPFSVTINEAVEIGKKYGTKDSGGFINGVLDRIKKEELSK